MHRYGIVRSESKSRMGGICRKPFSVLTRMWARTNDLYYGIDTDDTDYCGTMDRERGWPFTNVKSIHMDGTAYQSSNYANIRRIVRMLRIGGGDVLYELGCGKGRACCVFAKRKLQRIVGVEMNASLAAKATENAESLRGKRTVIEIRCEDVSISDLSDGTIYYMFNPFGATTLGTVLTNIELSLESNPRKVTIVYYHPSFLEILQDRNWLRQVAEFRTLTGCPVTFWNNL